MKEERMHAEWPRLGSPVRAQCWARHGMACGRRWHRTGGWLKVIYLPARTLALAAVVLLGSPLSRSQPPRVGRSCGRVECDRSFNQRTTSEAILPAVHRHVVAAALTVILAS
jgi:hypothetical protein